MSYVGEPFDHDVFVSYAHAVVETESSDMLRWTRHVAEGVRSRLASALNTADPSSYVSVFLDDRALRSGDPLTETLREKVQRSALLLVFMSKLYPKKTWCLDELKWFFFRPGRSRQNCTVLLVQPINDIDWPKHLRDEAGKPVVSHDLLDRAAGLPIGFGNHELPALNDALRKVHIELKGKLEQLRAQYQARRVYEQTTVPPIQPVLYLQARRQNLPDWQAVRAALEPYAIVNPDGLPEPVGEDALLQQQRQRRLEEYAECDGLVLLHASPDETLRVEIMAAYKDRQHLYQQRHRILPWAIVYRHGALPPVYSAYRVPCVDATSPDWPNQLIHVLRPNTCRPS
jgi:hypothetical protein